MPAEQLALVHEAVGRDPDLRIEEADLGIEDHGGDGRRDDDRGEGGCGDDVVEAAGAGGAGVVVDRLALADGARVLAQLRRLDLPFAGGPLATDRRRRPAGGGSPQARVPPSAVSPPAETAPARLRARRKASTTAPSNWLPA